MPALRAGRLFLERVPHRADLLDHLTDFCRRHRVRCGAVSVIGATSAATIGYYDQVKRVYARKTFRQEMEIVSCSGNISLKNGAPFLHLHVVLGNAKLRTFGGHLFQGSQVFAARPSSASFRGPRAGACRIPPRAWRFGPSARKSVLRTELLLTIAQRTV